jgi:hypothetical protein
MDPNDKIPIAYSAYSYIWIQRSIILFLPSFDMNCLQAEFDQDRRYSRIFNNNSDTEV